MDANKIIQEMIEKHPTLDVIQVNLVELCERLISIFDAGGKLFMAGNGGSATDTQHIAGELMKSFEKPRPLTEEEKARHSDLPYGNILANNLEKGFPAIALGLNHSLTSAILNDYTEPHLEFAQELWVLANEGDAFLGISTSGMAKNILYAMVTAKAKKMFVVGLTGEDGGEMKGIADITLCLPASVTTEIQEMHEIVFHTLCRVLESHYFYPDLFTKTRFPEKTRDRRVGIPRESVGTSGIT